MNASFHWQIFQYTKNIYSKADLKSFCGINIESYNQTIYKSSSPDVLSIYSSPSIYLEVIIDKTNFNKELIVSMTEWASKNTKYIILEKMKIVDYAIFSENKFISFRKKQYNNKTLSNEINKTHRNEKFKIIFYKMNFKNEVQEIIESLQNYSFKSFIIELKEKCKNKKKILHKKPVENVHELIVQLNRL